MRRINIERPIYVMDMPAAADAWLLLYGANRLKGKASSHQVIKSSSHQVIKSSSHQNVV
jgi:hypothetical protein